MKNHFTRLLLGFAIMLGSSQIATAQESDKLIDIKNGQLHTVQAGSGSYTVVFEAGFVSDLSVWQRVAPEIARQAKILVYSRASVGKSPARATTLNLQQHTEELKELISAANIDTPIILVGHSYGGWVVRQFAATYPNQVAGLVLVDPANESLEIELKKTDAQKVIQDQQRLEAMAPPSAKADLALVQGILDQGKLPNSASLPDVPTVLLTSIQERRDNPFYQETAPVLKVKRQLHAKMLLALSNSAHYVTSRSGHHIQMDEPHLVIAAINQVLTSVTVEAEKQTRQLAKRQARQALMQSIEKAAAEIQNNQIKEAEARIFSALKSAQMPESEINQLGYDMLTKGKQPILSEIVMRYNVEQFSESDNALDSHGETLLALGRAADAKKQFIKAIGIAKANSRRSPKVISGYEENLKKAEQAIAK